MRNIAILFGRELFDVSSDRWNYIAELLTDFEEVSEEEYDILMRYKNRLHNDYVYIFEKPDNLKDAINKTVKDCLNFAKKEISDRNKQKILEQNEKKKLEALKRKKKQLEKLKKELGE